MTFRNFVASKKYSTFVLTVLATLKFERAAYQGESFAFIEFFNTPPLPLQDAHLGGFFFYTKRKRNALR